MGSKRISAKTIAVIVICVIAAFLAWFFIKCSTPEYKYGNSAVEDARGAIFTADQYLDGKLDKREYEYQMIWYDGEINISDKAYEIYQTIEYMKDFPVDGEVLKYRNELADLIGEKKR